jgi:hypothetical protein
LYHKKTTYRIEYEDNGNKFNLTTEDKSLLEENIINIKEKGMKVKKISWWLQIDITKDFKDILDEES